MPGIFITYQAHWARLEMCCEPFQRGNKQMTKKKCYQIEKEKKKEE